MLLERLAVSAGLAAEETGGDTVLPGEHGDGKIQAGIVTGWRSSTCYLN